MDQLLTLQKQIADLKKTLDMFSSSSTIPRDVETAFLERLKIQTILNLVGIISSNGSSLTATVPLSGTKTYYVSDTSGGTVNRKLTFTSGILTAET